MIEHKPAVSQVRRIDMVTADLAAAERFFVAAFDFEVVEHARERADIAIVLGVPDARVHRSILRLGEQEIGLLTFDPPGRPIPAGGTSTDLWFQHFAIIVSDMDAAYDRLKRVGGFTPISEQGPQPLPPSSGSVTAFKFRDAEGHPLELLAFPPGEGPPYWRDKAATGGLCLGIDHSAIAVADTKRSIAFLERCFGLLMGEQTQNHGPEQSRLDAVADAAVTVTGLKPPGVPTPHVELLGYEVGARRPIPTETLSSDVAATVFVLETRALADIVEALTREGARFLSPGIVRLSGGQSAIAVLDPDGHRFVIQQQAA